MPKTNGSGQARTLTPDDLERLLNAAPSPEQRCLWAVMRWTGSRVTETLKLRWGAIHDDHIVFVKQTTKTRKTREVKIGERLNAELQLYREHWAQRHGRQPRPKDLAFPGRFGLAEPMTRQAADLALRQTLNGLELPTGISLHSFRRSLATTMAQGGASLRTISRFTGHASLDQLARYVDVTPNDELAALALIGG
ncbi:MULTISPECIES: tyrosine-type recombinase/integrase [unclassified Synechococcus]|uniref:tyrosine-type recombinase/integrase n=1 Tax=Synechococcales TaxID=1890424 RepID=UPI0016283437|nr:MULTISPECIES: tyrosine-type recombinase/integrase [unclassified Synechococcus]